MPFYDTVSCNVPLQTAKHVPPSRLCERGGRVSPFEKKHLSRFPELPSLQKPPGGPARFVELLGHRGIRIVRGAHAGKASRLFHQVTPLFEGPKEPVELRSSPKNLRGKYFFEE